jgi:GTPase
MKKIKEPLVVLFGRTNVGKSTIFNTLTEKQQALVADSAGTTRDSNYSNINWRNLNFKLVDTAGIIEEKIIKKILKSEDFDVEKQVQLQAKDYLKKADLILFVVDAKDGVLPDDKQLARQLQKINDRPIILVANKADNPRLRKDSIEFNTLGLGEPLPISAASGSGTGDLLDEIFEKLKDSAGNPEAPKIKEDIRVTILGKPNVGKSSLINMLAGENLQIVSHVAHTTREPNDITIDWKDYRIKLIDTAGMNRKGFKNVKKIKEQQKIERLSIHKSLQTLSKADIALLVLDISEEITQQEAKITEAIVKNKCSLIIVANKWDAIKDRDTKYYTDLIYSHFPYATWAPIQFVSALTGEKINHLKDAILKADEQRHIDLNDNALSKFLKQILKHHRPVKSRGTKKPYVHKLSQSQTAPPKFVLKIGAKDTLHESYIKFVENQLRKKFGFKGSPITFYIEKNRVVHGQHEQYLKPDNKSEDNE